MQGLDANKPLAGTSGRFWLSTDTKALYYDDGTSWQLVGILGGLDLTSHGARHKSGGADAILPDTIANVLTDHNKATHDALGIDADTVDGLQGSDLEQVANKGVANGYAPLDANAQVPVANLPDAVKTSNLQDVTTSRAFDTVYQNTTGKHLLVYATILGNTGAATYDFQAKIGTTSTPNTLVGQLQYYTSAAETNSRYQLVFVVPPSYYYAIYKATTDPASISVWMEVTI